LPSLQIPCIDGIPQVYIIEENLNMEKKKKFGENVSGVKLINLKLVDFSQNINKISLNRINAKGAKIERSRSTLI
jgi:hypothetical protein